MSHRDVIKAVETSLGIKAVISQTSCFSKMIVMDIHTAQWPLIDIEPI